MAKSASVLKNLTKRELKSQLKKLDGWNANAKETELTKTFSFPNFVHALAFVAKVTVHAEVLNHHPHLELSYGKVKVRLKTHDTKGITKLDIDLAKRIDRVVVHLVT